ncbi:uncharacterized protein TNCT_236901 [Trichonephila clavata]|uniref:Uncharacterized protein n=1 Tax=Trichonephila clavata TaxID=2740835 RepID=A0A8X6I240_TRICU|nr:uncharacterized protein TNCT_599641 [Trichonephila clavata]GFR34019.1 uncharacterized protein TNCT_236901 [Trichonephila clavata]
MWNVKEDTFSISYRETESKEEVTKRRILSLAHRIFDPIGFTCPITLIPKLLIQECWKIEASWDSKLPVDIERKFEAWKKQLIERYKTSRFHEDYRISILKMRICHYKYFVMLQNYRMQLVFFCEQKEKVK